MSKENVTKLKMPISSWVTVTELCEKLEIDPHQFAEVEAYGKLIFNLSRAIINRSFLPELLEVYRNE